jgi:hypothetical protein
MKQEAKEQAAKAGGKLVALFFDWVRERIQALRARRRSDPDKTPAERPSRK